ncbi:MAG: hypothetical protein HQK79_23260 [Desulfobacterales bacterium]|nr:hypothetical protein [Desulfobacterales bacterium]
MEFYNNTDIESFIISIQEQIEKDIKNILINNLNILINEDCGLSKCMDDRVPQKNIREIKEREKIASAYKKEGYMYMAAIEWEKCARDLMWNCICATLNISKENIHSINTYLTESKNCWFEFSGNFILPSQNYRRKNNTDSSL